MLSEQLAKAGISSAVFTTTANGATELDVAANTPLNVDGVTVTYFKRLTKDHSHFSPALLTALWRQVKQYQVVHIHAWWNLVSVFGCLIAQLRGVPVLVSPRGTLSPYSFNNKNIGVKWLMHRILGKQLLNRCHFHVTSVREKEAVLKIIKPKTIYNLPNFVKLPDQEIITESVASGALKLLFFSRIQEKKGIDLLLEALASISVPYTLTIAGDGGSEYINQLKRMADSLQIAGKITWAGFRYHNKFELLQQHDLFVLPSYDENFGNSVIESLSVGTPVLISEHVGLADYVREKKLGWICQTSATSIRQAINEIAKDKGIELGRIRTVAPGIISNDFKEAILVKRYIDMYHQLSAS